MAQQLIEGIVDKLLAYYLAELPAKLQALNTEYNDNVKLKAPTDNSYYAGARALLDGPDYPRVFVIGEGMNVLRYGVEFTDAAHEVSIIAAVKDSDTQSLQRQMYRWGRALWELMVARFFASTGDDYFALHDDGAIRLTFERPPSEETTSPYLGRAVLTATFEKQEAVA